MTLSFGELTKGVSILPYSKLEASGDILAGGLTGPPAILLSINKPSGTVDTELPILNLEIPFLQHHPTKRNHETATFFFFLIVSVTQAKQ